MNKYLEKIAKYYESTDEQEANRAESADIILSPNSFSPAAATLLGTGSGALVGGLLAGYPGAMAGGALTTYLTHKARIDTHKEGLEYLKEHPGLLKKKAAEKKKKDVNYLVPATTAVVPVTAIGVSKHIELGIKDKFASPTERAMNAALRHGNLRSTAALSILAGSTTTAAEAYRQHIMDERAKHQEKKIEQAVKKVVEANS